MKTAAAVSNGAHHQLVALVAHELRHPLVPIQHAAALLKQESLDAATIRRAAEIIERQVIGMNRLIGDLLEVSRMQVAGLELRLVRAPLSELMERVVESAAPVASERGQELLVSTPPEAVYLNMDVLRVAQALHNIIGNASKHGHIHVRVQRDGAQAVFEVSYKGFASGESEPDVGLGLHLARYLVEEHNGTLTIGSSGPGLGSVITVRLPCELAIAPPTERPVERPGAEPGGDRFPA